MKLFGRGGAGRKDQSGKQAGPEYAEISRLIADRLSSEQDEKVLIGIGDITSGEARGHKYRPSEVIDKLAEVLQFPHGDEVAEKAENALIERLKNGIHFEDAQYIITNRLGKRSERNAKFFVKMLDKLEYKPEMRRLAVEMLASFRGVELSPATVDAIERALLERMTSIKETEDVRKAIQERFGKEGKGRPQIKVEEGSKEETVLIDTDANEGQAPAKMIKAGEIPTQTMDVVEGLIVQIKDGTPVQKERAAKALAMMVQNSASRSEVERIISGAYKLKGEVPALCSLCDMVLTARKEMPLERGSVKPPMAFGPGNGIIDSAGRDKDKTPIVPVTLINGGNGVKRGK